MIEIVDKLKRGGASAEPILEEVYSDATDKASAALGKLEAQAERMKRPVRRAFELLDKDKDKDKRGKVERAALLAHFRDVLGVHWTEAQQQAVFELSAGAGEPGLVERDYFLEAMAERKQTLKDAARLSLVGLLRALRRAQERVNAG